MKLTPWLRPAAVSAIVLATAAASHAAMVTYTPTGVFSATGLTTYTNGSGATVTFAGTAGTLVGTPSFVTFGTFSTLGTTVTSATPVSSPFTLTITQAAPTIGSAVFSAQLSGFLSVSSSVAYLQFTSPLSVTIDAVQYTVMVADGGIAGRLNLAPTSTGGVVNLPGMIVDVPEPAGLIAAVALPGLLATRRRRV